MIYTFTCKHGCLSKREICRSIAKGPPSYFRCKKCGSIMLRDWPADIPMLDTSACRDHDDIAPRSRVIEGLRGHNKLQAVKKERQFQEHISDRRKLLASEGNRGSIRHTHSVPADLYHGKIKETGDKQYWQDPKNVERHSSCKVS